MYFMIVTIFVRGMPIADNSLTYIVLRICCLMSVWFILNSFEGLAVYGTSKTVESHSQNRLGS
jgi:hypothetical protein